ncbi:MAG: class I SAM-dependent methyltransferase [Smithella sp.]|nr:class I SAM-dependent methyltransferase [Smithella sp.]MDD5527621.1 class I SAM-dependent methyltransferase [Patescibacteria group bacterium]
MEILSFAENRKIEDELRNKGLFPNTSAPWQQNILELFIKKAMNKGAKIDKCLDAACGIGNNFFTEKKFFQKIHAFDKNNKALEFAADRSEKNKWNIDISQNDLESLELPKNKYGFVICTEAIEHTKEPRKALKNIWQNLNDGGYAIISIQNHFNLSALTKYLFELLFKKNWDAWGTHEYDGGYESYITFLSIRNICKKIGFKIVLERGADYLNSWFWWVTGIRHNYNFLDKHPGFFLGKIPIIKYLGMDYFVLLKK